MHPPRDTRRRRHPWLLASHHNTVRDHTSWSRRDPQAACHCPDPDRVRYPSSVFSRTVSDLGQTLTVACTLVSSKAIAMPPPIGLKLALNDTLETVTSNTEVINDAPKNPARSLLSPKKRSRYGDRWVSLTCASCSYPDKLNPYCEQFHLRSRWTSASSQRCSAL